MSKNFRLFNDIDVNHWTDRNQAYSAAHINSIPNPSAGITNIQPTSIPTPFARMELMNTAFKIVTESDLNGKTIYHKIVSHVLDLAELLFHAEQFPDLNVEQWSFSTDLNNLINSNNPKHKLLGETLQLYLQQGGATLGIHPNTTISIFSYQGKVLGATSPSTLFYTTGNTLDFGDSLKVAQQTFFSSTPTPLYKRDKEFQQYLYETIFSTQEGQRKVMNSLIGYLIKSHSLLEFPFSSTIDSIIHNHPDTNSTNLGNNYNPLTINNKNVLTDGLVYFQSKGVKVVSDFEIDTSLNVVSGNKPLALQNAYPNSLNYINPSTPWNVNITVPYFDEKNLSERRLPGQKIKYPYLTVSDFLQPYIIELPYNMSSQFYGSQFNRFKSYCLPLTELFFQFFTINDLLNRKVGGENMYKLTYTPAGVKVALRIPIKNNRYITFERIYMENLGNYEPDLYKNEGYIKDVNFSIGIFPFMKTPIGVSPKYRVARVVQDLSDLSINFRSNNQIITEKSSYLRSDGNVAPYFNTKYYDLEDNFDIIEIGIDNSSNVLIPLLKDAPLGAIKYIYGIDFGTSNTHIEYRNSIQQHSEPLSIIPNKEQVGYTFDVNNREVAIVDITEYEFISQVIDQQNDTGFPIKSVVSSKEHESLGAPSFSLGHVSIPFNYAKLDKIFYPNKLTSNLKWNNFANDINENTKVRLFLDELIFIIRNHVIQNGGSLTNTVINWSYPTSMSLHEKMQLENLFETVINKYFGDISISSITESIAPFYSLKNTGGLVAATRPAASIDIGGGTADIVIYQNSKAQKLSSFKFGANVLYQNGVNGNPSENGFKYLIEDFKQKNQKSNKYSKLKSHLDIYSNGSEETEIISYLFRIENSKEFNNDLIISFTDLIKNNTDTKIVYLYYFSAIIYHLAQYSDKMGFDPMSSISFSGQGSKILSFIDSSSQLKLTSKLVTKIFSHVYQKDIESIKLNFLPNSKQITAKGLLFIEGEIDTDDLIDVLISCNEKVLKSSDDISYRKLNLDNFKTIEKDVLDFNQMFFNLHKSIDFNATFGINMTKIDEYKNAVNNSILDYIIDVTKKYQDNPNTLDAKVNDTPFFYSIKQSIYELAKVSINKNND